MPTEGDNSGSDVEAEEEQTVFKYGDSELSDVIFDVDGKEFHCHKMILASKSEYFKAMFFSQFKEKEQTRITIDAKPTAFDQLLGIIYDGCIADPKKIVVCNYFGTLGITASQFNNQLWDSANDLFALADRFLLTDVVRHSFETMLIRYDRDCPYDKTKCRHCAVKLLLALSFNMDEYKTVNVSSRATIRAVPDRMSGNIQMPLEAIKFLLGRD